MVKCLQMIRDIAKDKDFVVLSKIKVGAIFKSGGLQKNFFEAVLLSDCKERVADILWELLQNGGDAGCWTVLCSTVVQMLKFEKLKEKQHQCQHLFDLVSIFLGFKSVPVELLETITKLIRDVRKSNIVEESAE
jgi:hypothetical protein